MTSTSCVIAGQTLQWKAMITTKTIVSRILGESPIFSYMNLKWKLRLSTFYEKQYYNTYYSIILTNCSGISASEKFKITTYIENPSFNWMAVQIQCSEISAVTESEILWVMKRDLAEEKLFGRETDINVIITCVFFPNAGLLLDVLTERNDVSTQVSVECPECQNRRCHITENNSSVKISESSLNILQNLQNLSENMCDMLDKSVMPDVVLKCGEVNIQAHKAVLSARSNIFSVMFQDPIPDSNKDTTIEIKDIDSSVLQEFLKFLYSGKMSDNLTIDMISHLYLASHKYGVSMLQKECARLMVSSLNEENCFQMLLIAELHADPLFTDGLADFISERPKLMKEDSWIKISEKSPKLAIKIYQKHFDKSFLK